MARCKQTGRAPPSNGRAPKSHRRTITPPPADTELMSKTPRVPQLYPTAQTPNNDNGNDGAARTPSVSPSKYRRHRCALPKSSRQPFLPEYRVGKCTRRTKLVLPGSLGSEKSFLHYCVDCVRSHLYLYCNGTSEYINEACEVHKMKYVVTSRLAYDDLADRIPSSPNTKHSTRHYDLVREYLLQKYLKDGLVLGREVTKPVLVHIDGCCHDKNSREGFDADIVAALEKVEAHERERENGDVVEID